MLTGFIRQRLSGILALAAPLLFSAVTQAADEPHPIVAQVKGVLKDPTKPFTMVVSLHVKDGMQAKFETAFAKAIKGTRKEKGSLTYDLSRYAKEPTRYLVYERWKSLKDLEEHMQTPHITGLLGELKDILSGPPEVKVLFPAGE